MTNNMEKMSISPDQIDSAMDLYMYEFIPYSGGRMRLEGRLGSDVGPAWRTGIVTKVKGNYVTTSGGNVYHLVNAKPKDFDDCSSMVSHFVDGPNTRYPTELEQKSELVQQKREELAVLEEEFSELQSSTGVSRRMYSTPHRHLLSPHQQEKTPISVESWLEHSATKDASIKFASPSVKSASVRKPKVYTDMPPPSTPLYSKKRHRTREMVPSPASPLLPSPKRSRCQLPAEDALTHVSSSWDSASAALDSMRVQPRSTAKVNGAALSAKSTRRKPTHLRYEETQSLNEVDEETNSVPISPQERRSSAQRRNSKSHHNYQYMPVDGELEEWSREEVDAFNKCLGFLRPKKFDSDKAYFKAISKIVSTKTWRQCAQRLEMIKKGKSKEENRVELSEKRGRPASSAMPRLVDSPVSGRKHQNEGEQFTDSTRIDRRNQHTKRSRRIRPDQDLGQDCSEASYRWGNNERNGDDDAGTLHSVPSTRSSARINKQQRAARLFNQQVEGTDELDRWTQEEVRVFEEVRTFMPAKRFRSDEAYFKAMARHIGTKTWQQCSERFDSLFEEENVPEKSRKSRSTGSSTKGRSAKSSTSKKKQRQAEDEESCSIPVFDLWGRKSKQAEHNLNGESRALGVTYVKSPLERQRSPKVKLAGKSTWKRKEQMAKLVDKINEGYSPSLFDEEAGTTPNKNKRYKLPPMNVTPLNIAGVSRVESERRQLRSPDDDFSEISREVQRKARKGTHRFLKSLPMKEQWPLKLSQGTHSGSTSKLKSSAGSRSGHQVKTYLQELDRNIDHQESDDSSVGQSECYYSDDE